MPSTIERLHRSYQGRGLRIVAVNIEESRETVAAWVRRSTLSVPVVLDRDGRVSQAYRVTATPTVFLLDHEGRLVARAAGARDWTGDRGRAVLDKLLEAAPR